MNWGIEFNKGNPIGQLVFYLIFYGASGQKIITILFKNILHIPELRNNLCNVTVELGRGAKLESEGKVMVHQTEASSDLIMSQRLRMAMFQWQSYNMSSIGKA